MSTPIHILRGWEGSLIRGMKMEALYSDPSSNSCIRKDAPKWQATPTGSSPVQVGVEGGFNLNWLIRGCFLAKSDLPDGFFVSTNLKGGERIGTISVPVRPYLEDQYLVF